MKIMIAVFLAAAALTSDAQAQDQGKDVVAAADSIVVAFARHDPQAYFAQFDPEATFVFYTTDRRLENRAAVSGGVGKMGEGSRVPGEVLQLE